MTQLLLFQQAFPFQKSQPEFVKDSLDLFDIICKLSVIIIFIIFLNGDIVDMVTNIIQQFYYLLMCVHLSK